MSLIKNKSDLRYFVQSIRTHKNYLTHSQAQEKITTRTAIKKLYAYFSQKKNVDFETFHFAKLCNKTAKQSISLLLAYEN